MIVLHRKRGAAGYYCFGQFAEIAGDSKVDEISLNPTLLDRPERDVLATLVHEMVHLWQYHFGNPSRGGYHNREWATEMERVGLIPSDTGKVGGKRTGQRMTHYIADGGSFAVSYESLRSRGFLKWSAVKQASCTRKPSDKIKYSCKVCGLNAWGKPGIQIACLDCNPSTNSTNHLDAMVEQGGSK